MIKLLILNTIKLFYYDIKFTWKILGDLVLKPSAVYTAWFTPLAVYTTWFTLSGLRLWQFTLRGLHCVVYAFGCLF
jgi:hypothetical protein